MRKRLDHLVIAAKQLNHVIAVGGQHGDQFKQRGVFLYCNVLDGETAFEAFFGEVDRVVFAEGKLNLQAEPARKND